MSFNPYERTLRKVADPLTEETRRVRKALLGWSLVGVGVTVGGLFPTEITALGLKITPTNKAILFGLLGAVVLYHLVAFFAYAASDAARWYANFNSTEWEDDVAAYEKSKSEHLSRTKLSSEDREYMEEHERRLGALWRGEASRTDLRLERVAPYISSFRACVEFPLPAAFGCAALVLLVIAMQSAT